nr:hypothetical protein [Tanacetum cinerariifolium]
MGRFYGIASIAKAIPSLFRQFVAVMRHLMTMTKVAFLLVIELGVLPLMCGWWLDFCTIIMFGKSMGQRIEFFSTSPLASSLIHWVGLRNGVLYFLRDPADRNYNLFRDLIDVLLLQKGVEMMIHYDTDKIAMEQDDIKGIGEDKKEKLIDVDYMTGNPLPSDILLYAVPVCAPYTALQSYKLRVKIISGTTKKGKGTLFTYSEF